MATLRKAASITDVSGLNKNAGWYKKLASLCEKDINGKRNEYYFPAPEFLTQLLQVEDNDRPLWYCLFNIAVSIVVTILLIPYFMEKPWYYCALWTVARFALLGLPRFVLALHFSAHVPIIKPHFLNRLFNEYFCCVFYGLPPGMYKFHHIVMHHKEDNIHPRDLSSTMPYQRDNFFHFLHYWLRFEFGIWVELPYFLLKKGYYQMFFEGMFMLAFWWVMVYFVYTKISVVICLWTFLIPQIIMSFLLMFGNFSQHMFVNPNKYDDDHQLTVNLVNTPYNQLTFNDGYHIIHHKYPTLHWTQLPQKFMQDRELVKHGNANAIILDNIDYFLMGVYIFSGNLKGLAKHFVPISDAQSKYTIDDIVNLFKQRLPPIAKP